MAKRKLTPRLKDFLYDNRWKVKLSDYSGEALAYLKRLRAASKAAKKRKESVAKIGNTVIPRNSEIYEQIEKSAQLKKQTVKRFLRENKDAVLEYMKEGRIVIERETSYAISDISKLPAKSKVFINGQRVSKGDAIYALQSFTSSAMQHTNTVIVNYEMTYTTDGDLYLELPEENEIEDAEELIDADPNDTTYDELINNAKGLRTIQS